MLAVTLVAIPENAGRPACFRGGSSHISGAPKGIRNLTCQFQAVPARLAECRIVAGHALSLLPASLGSSQPTSSGFTPFPTHKAREWHIRALSEHEVPTGPHGTPRPPASMSFGLVAQAPAGSSRLSDRGPIVATLCLLRSTQTDDGASPCPHGAQRAVLGRVAHRRHLRWLRANERSSQTARGFGQ